MVLLGWVLGILAGTLINYLVADKVIYYLMNMELGAYHNRPSVYAGYHFADTDVCCPCAFFLSL